MIYEIVLNALGDPTRRQLFERLRGGPSSVGALAEGMPVSRPAVSQHLKILKEAGLVTHEAQGARRVYCVSRDGLAALKGWVEGFWEDGLEAYQAEMQRQLDERKCT